MRTTATEAADHLAARITQVVVQQRLVVGLLITLLSLGFAFAVSGLEVRNQTAMWFRPDDPDYVRYRQLQEDFGNDHTLLVAVSSEDLITPPVLQYLRGAVQSIEKIRGVRSVAGLTSVLRVPRPTLGFKLPSLTLPYPATESQAEDVRKELQARPAFRDFLLSEDGKVAQLVVRVTDEGSQDLRGDIVEAVTGVMESDRPQNVDYVLGGPLFVGVEIDRFTAASVRRVSLVAGIMVMLFLLLLLRRVADAVVVFVAAGTSTLWAVGTYALSGHAFNMMTTMIVPLTLVVSISTAVHIVVRYREEAPDAERTGCITRTVSAIWIPCLLTSATTATGLVTLVASPVAALDTFGFYAAAAMGISYVVCMTLVPIGLSLVARRSRTSRTGWRLPVRWAAVSMDHPCMSIGLFAFMAVAAAVGASRLEVNTNQIESFPADSRIVSSSRYIDAHFGGIYPVQLVLRSGTNGLMLEPAMLGRIEVFCSAVERDLGLRHSPTLTDVATEVNAFFGDPRGIAETSVRVGEGFSVLRMTSFGRDLLSSLADDSYSRTLMTFRMASTTSTREMIEITEELSGIANEHFGDLEVRAEVTGIVPLYARLAGDLVQTQAVSFSLAMGATVLFVGLVFLHLRALLALICVNVIPILLTLGLMGYLGIYIDAATAMIATVAFGIVVDDTIHLLYRWRREMTAGAPFGIAMRNAVDSVGGALVTTSVATALGMLTLVMSGFRPLSNFGILMAATLLTALAADLVLGPAVLSKIRGRIIRVW